MSETYPRKNPCETLFVGHTSSIVDSTTKVILFFDTNKKNVKIFSQNVIFYVKIFNWCYVYSYLYHMRSK